MPSPIRETFELLDYTHPDPVWNVAMDEALLERRNAGGGRALLRFWEPAEPMVVIGRSSRIASEVKLDTCQSDGVPVVRRCSGGAAIVSAPGCLMYAVFLPYTKYPSLKLLDQAHRFVMGTIQQAISRLGIATEFRGTCDLVLRNRKFSGNAMRVTRDWLLYHGTMITSMELSLVSKYLGEPDRQPDYREQRAHDEFITQLPLSANRLKNVLIDEWNATVAVSDWAENETEKLVREKYALRSWNHKR